MEEISDRQNTLSSVAGELVTYHPKKSEHFCDTFIYEPETMKEQPCGRLFIAVELHENNKKSAQIAEAIATIMQHEYYKNMYAGIVANFEAALAKVNEVMSEIASHGETGWVGHLNATIAAQKDHFIVMSSIGHMKAYLLRNGEDTVISNGEESESSANRPFDTIATGEVMPRDNIIITTPELLNTMALQRIGNVLEENPILTSLRILESSMVQTGSTPICAVMVKINTERALTLEATKDQRLAELPPEELTQHSQLHRVALVWERLRSHPAFVRTERIAKRLAYHAQRHALNAWDRTISFIEKVRGRKFYPHGTRALNSSSVSEAVHQPGPELPSDDKVKIRERLSQGIRATQEWKENVSLKGITSKSIDSVKNLPSSVRNMSRKTQLILATSGSLLIIFIVGIGVFSAKKAESARISSAQSLYEDALDKVESASASLIYKDTDGATSLLNQADDLNKQVLGTKYYSKEAEELQNRITAERERVQHINDVQGIEEVVDLGEAASAGLAGLTLDGNKLLVGETSNNKVIKIDPTAKKFVEANSGSKNIGAIISGTYFAGNDSILFLTNRNEMAEFDMSDEKLTKLDVDLPTETPAIASYGNKNVYALDKQKDQVMKYTKSFSGFSQGTSWLKAKTDLSDAISLAIDGSIYILFDDGHIEKFLSGIKDDFGPLDLEKPLSHPTKIVTSEKLSGVYVLDPENRRVLVLSKTGKFEQEWTSDNFQNAHDIVVDEQKGIAYVASGTKIYSFSTITAD